MKKLLLMAAFAGLLGSTIVANTKGDDKDKGKKECKKGEKSCAGEKKEGCEKGDKACCKKKGSESNATKAEEKKDTEKK